MKYKANPVEVEAVRIIGIGSLSPNGNLMIECEDGITRQADAPMLSRISPEVGDYWVTQSDNYEYLNPKAVFERKYRPAKSEYLTDPLALAVLFHVTYERLAPNSGYETRKETRVFDPESSNGKLMIATCAEIQKAVAQD